MEFTDSIEPKDVWKLTSWYRGVRRHAAPPLNRPDGTKAITPEEKADTLFGSLFQPPPELENERGVDPVFPNHNTRPFVDVTEEEVGNAISSTSNTSAPGRSGIGYKALKWVWHTRPEEILRIMQMGLRLGEHHELWKTATTVVLPKPNKPSYSDPRAYRPIQLLECLGKLLEKVVATRVSYDIGKYNLVPHEQFGGRSTSSCIDAAMSLVHDIESAWKHGQVVSVLAIDISRFFDNVNHKRLVRVVYEMGFSLPVVRWIQSFISDRKAAIRLDGNTSEPRSIASGIPQGSPISPVLSVIYAAEVITTLKDANILTPTGIPVTPKSYVDDYEIAAISGELKDNVSSLNEGLNVVVNSLAKIGMTCDITKLDLQHFTRRPSDREFPSLVANIYGKQITVAAPKSMRWLGVFFDKRLSFHEHVKIMSARSQTVINGLRCLGNTVRGLSQANMRVLYRTCAFPILSYAAPVWFREDKRQKGLIKLLDTTQNKALRLICGAFRTTPCAALRILGHIPPIVHLLRRLSEAAAIRFSRLHPLSPIVQRLPNDWRQRHRPTEKTPFSTPHSLKGTNPARHTIIQHLSSKSSPNLERLEPFHSDNAPWHVTAKSLLPRLTISPDPCDKEARPAYSASLNKELVHSKHDPSLLLVYCDGSRWKPARGTERSGYGVVIYHCAKPIFTYSIGLGESSTVFDAEMYALAHAGSKVKRILDTHTTVRTVKFYSDSTSSLKVIFDPSIHPAQQCSLLFRTNIVDLLDRMPDLVVNVAWSPGHTDIIGNDAADKAAKAGVKLPSMIDPTQSHAKMACKMRAQTMWSLDWHRDKMKRLLSNTPSGFELADVNPPKISPNDTFRSTPRELFGRLTQTLTGHGYTGEFYQRFVPDETAWCRCTDPDIQHVLESREHILHECDRYAYHRPILRNQPTSTLFGSESGIQRLITFMHKSGAFTKNGQPRLIPALRFLKKPRDHKPP